MWEKLTNIASTLIQISSLLVKNQKEIDDLQEQITEVQRNVELVARDIQHFMGSERDKRQHFTDMAQANQTSFTDVERLSHRSNVLDIENRLAQIERQLPPNSAQRNQRKSALNSRFNALFI